MVIFAELQIELDEDGVITLTQPCPCQDDQIIYFPPHQAEAICAAILKVAKTAEG